MNHGDTEDTESFGYHVVETVECLIIGLGAMIRQAKQCGGIKDHGHLPFNLCGIPILSAIYEGMIKEIVVTKLRSEHGNSLSPKYVDYLCNQAEHQGGLKSLKKLYRLLFDCELFTVLDSSNKTSVCCSLKAMDTLRNKFAHGVALVFPEKEIPDGVEGGFVKEWQVHFKGVSSYFQSEYTSSNVIGVLKQYDVLEGFVEQLKILARTLQEEHKDLGIQSLGLILNYKYGKSNSLRPLRLRG